MRDKHKTKKQLIQELVELRQREVELEAANTERKRAEEELRAEKEFSENTLNALVDTVFVFDPNTGTPLRWNKAFNEISGCTDEEIASKKAPDDWYSEEDLRRAEAATEKIFLEGQATVEMSLITKDERLIPAEYTGSLIKNAEGKPQYLIAVGRDITARKQAEEALRESEQKYRELVENISDVIYAIDEDGLLTYVSPAIESFIGYSPSEVIGHHLKEFIYEEDLPRLMENFQSVFSGHTTANQYRALTKHGEIRWMRTSSRPVLMGSRVIGVHGVLADITERKRAEEALRESEEKWRSLVENAPDIIFTVDREGKILFINYAPAGLTAEEALGTSVYDYVVPKYRETTRQSIKRVFQTGNPDCFEIAARGPHDITSWYSTRLGPVKRDGEVVAVMLITRDITETKQAEEEIRQRTAQLEALREVGLEITAELDLDSVIRYIVLRAMKLVGETGGGLHLYRVDRDVLEWSVSIGPNVAPIGTVLHRGEGLSGKVWESGEPLIVDDYQTWEGRAVAWEDYRITAAVGVPVRWGEDLLGVLNIWATGPRTFSPADAELLSLLATQAAIAIRNARLYEAEQERHHITETLRQTSTVLSSTLELDEVLGLILQQLRQVIPYDSASVQRLENERLEIVACQGFERPGKVMGLAFPLDLKFPNSRVVTTKAPLAIEDVTQGYPHFKDEGDNYESGRIRSWLGVPLIVKDQVIGMIALDRAEVHPYTAEEVQLAMTFANQAAIAIENALLYQKTQHLAITDGLTGLYNRRHFYDLLEREIESVNRYGDHLSLIMLDIDGFKAYNDTFGHLAGDALLKELAQLLTRDIRKVDIAARYGGDEFVLFFPRTDKKRVGILAERIRASVERHRFPGEEGLSRTITISLGVAVCPEDATETEALVRAADMALLEAKKRGNMVYACG